MRILAATPRPSDAPQTPESHFDFQVFRRLPTVLKSNHADPLAERIEHPVREGRACHMTTSVDVVIEHVEIVVRDQERLASTVFRPTGPGTYPTLLLRTPYDDNPLTNHQGAGRRAAERGYCYIVQSVRGRYESTGTHEPIADDRNDGYDTIEWVVSQPWSDGRIGLVGNSYPGMAAWNAALSGHPAVKAVAVGIIGSVFDGMCYVAPGVPQLDTLFLWPINQLLADQISRTGVQQDDPDVARAMDPAVMDATLEFLALGPEAVERRAELTQRIADLSGERIEAAENLFRRPLSAVVDLLATAMPWIREWAAHPDPRDGYWATRDYVRDLPSVAAPTIHHGGWHDLFIRGTFRNFLAVSGSPGAPFQRLIVSPFTHFGPDMPVGEWSPPLSAIQDPLSVLGSSVAPDAEPVTRWIDHFLCGAENDAEKEAPISLYVQRADRWRHASQWPLPETQWRTLYLSSTGRAGLDISDGRLTVESRVDEPTDVFEYDPTDPVPSVGGNFLGGVRSAGIFDQALVESRDDVLVFTSDVLEHGIEVTGPVRLELFVSTSAVDTDFTARLTDVNPDNRSTNICDGICRLQFRLDAPGLVEPGSVQRVSIELSPTSYWFAPGHAIRLQVSSSNFPLTAPNPNTGRNQLLHDHGSVIATQAVHHSAEFPSHLVLPVIHDDEPASRLGDAEGSAPTVVPLL